MRTLLVAKAMECVCERRTCCGMGQESDMIGVSSMTVRVCIEERVAGKLELWKGMSEVGMARVVMV